MCLNSTKTTVHWRHGDGDIEKFKYFCFQHSTDNMTIPPSPKTSQLTVFTQTQNGFHHAAVVSPGLAPGSSGLMTLTSTALWESYGD